MDFDLPFFRLANKQEIESIQQLVFLEPEDIVYCVEASTSCSIERIPFYIVAQSVRFEHEIKKIG